MVSLKKSFLGALIAMVLGFVLSIPWLFWIHSIIQQFLHTGVFDWMPFYLCTFLIGLTNVATLIYVATNIEEWSYDL